MNEATDEAAIIYTDRKQFLIASATETRPRWYSSDSIETEEIFYGFANTEHQFRKALCDLVFPNVRKLTRDEMTKMMADELSGEQT